MKSCLLIMLLLTVAAFSQPSYRFVILGDRTGTSVPGVFPKMVAQAAALQPAPLFFTNVGDQIQGYEKDTALLVPQWAAFDSELAPITKRFAWHPVAGNHDISYDSILPFYQHHRGNAYYSYDVGPDRFIVLDASRFDDPADMDTAQLAFLKKTLAASAQVRYLFCFYHKPFFSLSPRDKIMDSLHALFKAGGVDYVFNGHYHTYLHGIRDNIHYIMIGSSGGDIDDGPGAGQTFHYGLVDVSPSGVRVRPVTMAGETLSVDWLTDTVVMEKAACWKASRFKNVDLSWKDTAVGKGTFELTFTNPLKTAVTVNMAWDPAPQTPKNPWKLEPTSLNLQLPGDSSRTILFNYELNGIATGPKINIRIPIRKDTVVAMKRVLVRRQIAVNNAGGKISFDGQLTEKAWQPSLKRASHVFGSFNRAVDYDSTWISFTYDKENLYGAFICHDPSPDSAIVLTQAKVRDVCDGEEDVIAFFFNDPEDTVFCYKAYFNPVGSIRDAKTRFLAEDDNKSLSWSGVTQSKVIKTRSGWQGEFRIPWKSMGLAKPKSLYFNCKRASKRFPKRGGNVAFQLPFDGTAESGASALLVP